MARCRPAKPTSLNEAPAPSSPSRTTRHLRHHPLPNDEAPASPPPEQRGSCITPPYNIEAMNEGMASSGVKA